MSRSVLASVNDPTQVGLARRAAAALCRSLSFSQTVQGNVEIVVTEAATNLLKHAGQGKIILRGTEANAIEVLAVDKGPGMKDVAKCLQDGFSTAGSPGTGLGAISRLARIFDLYSQADHGTALLAQVRCDQKPGHGSLLAIGAVCTPLNEGEQCGDDWFVRDHGRRAQILLVDGLGHGVLAAQAADRAVEIFRKLPYLSPADVVQSLHGPLRSTRGASLAVAEIDLANQVVRYSGVGNISGTILQGEGSRSLVSHNGTVGHEMHRVHEFQYPWVSGSTLVMHSDGLLSRWRLDNYPGLAARHPSLMAGILYRDFIRGRDDVTVFVARENDTVERND
jgi:anti-sigma regulatory factor (Ser/Thr protein kinase)